MKPLAAFIAFLVFFACAFFVTRALAPGESREPGTNYNNAAAQPATGEAPRAEANSNITINNESAASTPAAGAHSESNVSNENVKKAPVVWPDCTVTGRILDYDGKPAVGARVKRTANDGGPVGNSKEIRTNESGNFSLKITTTSPREVFLWVRHRGQFDTIIPKVKTAPNETIDIGEVRLSGAANVRVHITDPGGRPVPNVEIQYKPEGAPTKPPSPIFEYLRTPDKPRAMRALTNESGMFTFEPVTAGRADVSVTNEYYITQKKSQSSLGLSPEIKKIELAPAAAETVKWIATNVGILRGRATHRGKPYANATLSLVNISKEGSWFPVRARTDESGNFTFPPVPASNYAVRKGDWALHFDVSTRMEAAGGEVQLSREETRLFQLLYKPQPGDDLRKVHIQTGDNVKDVDFGDSARVEVYVTDDKNRPVRDCYVRLFDPPKPGAEIVRGYAKRMQRSPLAIDKVEYTNNSGIAYFDDVPRGARSVARVGCRSRFHQRAKRCYCCGRTSRFCKDTITQGPDCTRASHGAGRRGRGGSCYIQYS